eukprot:5907889-Alexandrium_andersonii.AAC.1
MPPQVRAQGAHFHGRVRGLVDERNMAIFVVPVGRGHQALPDQDRLFEQGHRLGKKVRRRAGPCACHCKWETSETVAGLSSRLRQGSQHAHRDAPLGPGTQCGESAAQHQGHAVGTHRCRRDAIEPCRVERCKP